MVCCRPRLIVQRGDCGGVFPLQLTSYTVPTGVAAQEVAAGAPKFGSVYANESYLESRYCASPASNVVFVSRYCVSSSAPLMVALPTFWVANTTTPALS